MKTKKNINNVKPNRRDFLVNVSLATAALTLNSAFGFPVETEQGNGKLFLKIEDSDAKAKNGIHQFSEIDLEKLKSGKMESLSIKLGISNDQKNWKSIQTSITDRNFMKQLTEMARKA